MVGADVRLRGDSGSTLSAISPVCQIAHFFACHSFLIHIESTRWTQAQAAVHLAGDRSGALFLTITSPNAVARLSTPEVRY